MENLIVLAFFFFAVVGATYKVAEWLGFVEKDGDEPEKLWSVMNTCRACSRLLFIIIGAILFLIPHPIPIEPVQHLALGLPAYQLLLIHSFSVRFDI